MNLMDFVKKFEDFEIAERRCNDERYCELVFPATDRERWFGLFESVFGDPYKPAGTKPSKEVTELTKDYGYIRTNQVLFKKDFSEHTLMVMLLPWDAGDYITMKLISL